MWAGSRGRLTLGAGFGCSRQAGRGHALGGLNGVNICSFAALTSL
jgi:hypothetical protein